MACDLLVIGSGPCGAQAAKEAVEAGLGVVVLDVGFDDERLEASVPYAPFSDLRRTDAGQRRYFLGSEGDTERTVNDRIGAHFTPPRSYIKREVERWIPVRSDTFFPELSLALGGLGAGWGSGTAIFEPFELRRAGLPADAMGSFYDAVAEDVGISGAIEDDTAALTLPSAHVQRAAELDTNCDSIFRAYARRRASLNARGFLAGRVSMAMITEERERLRALGRGPNPYFDMDFYTNFDRSIYRPKFTIEELASRPNFTYVRNALAETFEQTPDGVVVKYRNVADGTCATIVARKLLLAANPLNTARIALRSRGIFGAKQPLLCNPYHYVPAINLRMLGREAADRRHSMGQIVALYKPRHRGGESVLGAFCSYRSLLHFRLVREMPLPVSLGLLVSRVLQNSLTVVGIHHPEHRSERKWVSLAEGGGAPVLEAGYELSDAERSDVREDMRGMLRCLRELGCIPFSVLQTPPGSSIHYAGTIPFATAAADAPLACEPDGRLIGSPDVYVADSSSWRYLPAKGPTFTIMANGRRVARNAARALAAGR